MDEEFVSAMFKARGDRVFNPRRLKHFTRPHQKKLFSNSKYPESGSLLSFLARYLNAGPGQQNLSFYFFILGHRLLKKTVL